MPVGVRRIDGKYRIVEPGGGIATTPQGHARDGGGHSTRAAALRQQRAINANITKAGLKTLYVSRRLLNADEFIAWARSQGFTKTVQPSELHVTIAFSRAEVKWNDIEKLPLRLSIAPTAQGREVARLGDKGAVVLFFRSQLCKYRWREFRDIGCSWDFPSYRPHVTITYDGSGVDISNVEPFTGKLSFTKEIFSEVVEDWEQKIDER